MRELLKLTIILGTICSLAATALALAYNLTKEPIALQQRLKMLNAIKALQPDYNNEPDKDFVDVSPNESSSGGNTTIRYYLAKRDGMVTGVVFTSSSKGYGGSIELMVGATPEGTLTGIHVLRHSETPGLGAKIVQESFLGQFRGKNFSSTKWMLKKEGGDFDQISGATISPRAVIDAVHRGLKAFYEHRAQILNKQTGEKAPWAS